MKGPDRRFLAALLAGVLCSCGSPDTDNGLVDEDAVYLLQSRYELATDLIETTCNVPLGDLSSVDSLIEVRQTGNYINWTQYAYSAEGRSADPIVLDGAVCRGASGVIELRLRGRSVSRRSSGSGFCRTEYSMPASPSSCDFRIDEICRDPAALRLTLDTCSGGFFGRVNSCLRYEELCSGTPDCQLSFNLSATPVNPENLGVSCPERSPSDFVDVCQTDCERCGCLVGPD